MTDARLEHVLDALERHRQRATADAVAAFVDADHTVLAGRPRDPRHSFIVNRVTGLPSGYRADEWHPELRARPYVISSIEQLDDWLRNPS